MSAIFQQAAADWSECRDAFELARLAAYELAALECNGRLLTDAAYRAGLTGLDLFHGPEQLARRRASEELLEHWERYPRPSLARFERSWVAGSRWAQ